MNKIAIIIRREFLTRIKKKSFILLTILMPFIMCAVVIVPLLLAQINSDEESKVVIVDKTGHYADCFKDTPNFYPLIRAIRQIFQPLCSLPMI